MIAVASVKLQTYVMIYVIDFMH